MSAAFLICSRRHHDEAENPFSGLDLQEAIDLRWTLRHIRAKRWAMFPIDPSHQEKIPQGFRTDFDDKGWRH